MKQYLKEKNLFVIPKEGDVVKGIVIAKGKNEIHIDIPGYKKGIVRGPGLQGLPQDQEIKVGDEVEATVIELENERGEIELSFRDVGEKIAWEKAREFKDSGEVLKLKISEANKGGLIAKLQGLSAFLPVSQLSEEHYPRVSGGETGKILEKLRVFINKTLEVQVITADQENKKLIISEKSASEIAQRQALAKFNVGDKVEAEVQELNDFGTGVKFDSAEGFIHISELSWSHVENPADMLKAGDKINAEIISIDGARAMLSLKRLTPDPWKEVLNKFKVGDIVRGKIIKSNPFGLFVEVDRDIHGLAHISELGEGVKDPLEAGKIGDELDFKIIALEPENHRMSLSLKALK